MEKAETEALKRMLMRGNMCSGLDRPFGLESS